MKISEGGRGGVLLKEWTTHSLSRGLVIKTTLTLNLHFCTRVIFVPFHQVHAVFCL